MMDGDGAYRVGLSFHHSSTPLAHELPPSFVTHVSTQDYFASVCNCMFRNIQ